MSHASAQAWAWSKRHSPLLRLIRGLPARLRPHAEAGRILAEAGLPDPLRERIDLIVRCTGLWSDERADIARELIAHTHDAIANAPRRAPEDIAADLGEPRVVSRLLRRSAKRKRPWLWRARRRTMQAFGASLCLLVLSYGVLFARFNLGSPSIRTNYLTILNRHNADYTEEQQALPSLEALWIAYRREDNRTRPARDELYQASRTPTSPTDTDPVPDRWAIEQLHAAEPTDLGYDDFVAWMRSIRPLLDDAQHAAALPTLGGTYSDSYDTVELDGGHIRLSRPRPFSKDPADNEPVNGPIMFWVDDTFISAKLLAADALLASREQDPARARDRLVAVLRLAGLCGREPFAKSRVVGSAIQAVSEQTLLRIIEGQPHFLSDETLAELCHAIGATRQKLMRPDLTAERIRFADLMQRFFTDDGSGDGQLTPDGVREIVRRAYSGDFGYVYDLPITPRTSTRMIGPLYDLAVASRAEHVALHDALTSMVQDAIDAGPRSLERFGPRGAYTLLYELRVRGSDRFPVIEVLLTDLHRLPATVHTGDATTGATLLVIAAHLHHRRTGSWPDSPEVLVPALLPAAPMDPFDPDHPLRILIRDDRLVVYSVGTDGDDDHATPYTEPDDGPQRDLVRRYTPADELPPDAKPTPDCDWILYPLPN